MVEIGTDIRVFFSAFIHVKLCDMSFIFLKCILICKYLVDWYHYNIYSDYYNHAFSYAVTTYK